MNQTKSPSSTDKHKRKRDTDDNSVSSPTIKSSNGVFSPLNKKAKMDTESVNLINQSSSNDNVGQDDSRSPSDLTQNDSSNQQSSQSQPQPQKRRWGEASTSVNPVQASIKSESISSSTISSADINLASSAAAKLAAKIAVQQKQLEIKAKLAKLQGKLSINLNSKIESSNLIKTESSTASSFAPLLLDSKGRPITSTGEIIQPEQRRLGDLESKTLEAVRKAEELKQFKNEKERLIPSTQSINNQSNNESSNPYFDPRLYIKSEAKYNSNAIKQNDSSLIERQPRRAALKFIEPGSHIRKAQTMRAKQFESEIKISKYEGIKIKDYIDIISHPNIENENELKQVNWWDSSFLQSIDDQTELTYNNPINISKITHLIYHPPPIVSLFAPPELPPQPVLLTKREREKVKRREKAERRAEERENAAIGITSKQHDILQSNNKMKLSNLSNVLLSQSVAGPSAMEASVKKQAEMRREFHESTNAERALTTEQRHAKQAAKLREDTSLKTYVTVFIVGALTSHRQRRYKMEVNAQKWNLTGVTLLVNDDEDSDQKQIQLESEINQIQSKIQEHQITNKNNNIEDDTKCQLLQSQLKNLISARSSSSRCNLCIIEGGPKSIRKFSHLLTHRIDWTQTADGLDIQSPNDENMNDDDDENDQQDSNGTSKIRDLSIGNAKHIEQVWNGELLKSQFIRFAFENCRSEISARQLLQRHSSQQYWDLARTKQQQRIIQIHS